VDERDPRPGCCLPPHDPARRSDQPHAGISTHPRSRRHSTSGVGARRCAFVTLPARVGRTRAAQAGSGTSALVRPAERPGRGRRFVCQRAAGALASVHGCTRRALPAGRELQRA
jgi:hypothetical protein